MRLCPVIPRIEAPRVLHVVALFCPPLALLLCGKVFQAMFSGLICLCLLFALSIPPLFAILYLFPVVWAWSAISAHKNAVALRAMEARLASQIRGGTNRPPRV